MLARVRGAICQDAVSKRSLRPSRQTTRPRRPGRPRSQARASAPIAYAAVASMSAQVRSSARTVTDATAPGAATGAGVGDVLAAVGGAGRRDRAAAYLDGGEQLLRVARVLDADPPGGTRVVGDVADHVATRGEADVGVGERAQVGGRALHRPALDHAAGVEGRYAVGPGPAYVEGAARLDPRPLAEGEHLVDLGRAVGQADLAPRQSRDTESSR